MKAFLRKKTYFMTGYNKEETTDIGDRLQPILDRNSLSGTRQKRLHARCSWSEQQCWKHWRMHDGGRQPHARDDCFRAARNLRRRADAPTGVGGCHGRC
jgi:hypothetical protein